jgi:hypothetical protein
MSSGWLALTRARSSDSVSAPGWLSICSKLGVSLLLSGSMQIICGFSPVPSTASHALRRCFLSLTMSAFGSESRRISLTCGAVSVG